ncbi:OmpA family protein [Candidatus Cytomitobacter primus]|uniref:OmpA family protein n=1 Tax=Candidatus Cytomitobacter primus TaxID=2066024 RepID=A0A5C0UF85_9PROT|nr:OmpA family protein [Candidatus Cytomitobacter primus]QEK38439.1 OmpA family protein [Candidatus Cytomitobacter primus]
MKSFLTLGLVVSAFLLSGCDNHGKSYCSKKAAAHMKKESGCFTVHFGHDKKDLNHAARHDLDSLIVWMKKNPKSSICLSAHASAVGNVNYNMRLSQKRSNSVKEYLVNHGISESRIEGKSYGESKLPAGKGHASDNRVVIITKYS